MEKLRKLLAKLGKEDLLDGMGDDGAEASSHSKSAGVNPPKKQLGGVFDGVSSTRASDTSAVENEGEEAGEGDDLAKLEAIIAKLTQKHSGQI